MPPFLIAMSFVPRFARALHLRRSVVYANRPPKVSDSFVSLNVFIYQCACFNFPRFVIGVRHKILRPFLRWARKWICKQIRKCSDSLQAIFRLLLLTITLIVTFLIIILLFFSFSSFFGRKKKHAHLTLLVVSDLLIL